MRRLISGGMDSKSSRIARSTSSVLERMSSIISAFSSRL